LIANTVLDLAKAQALMIATAESCTGGMVIAALTDIPGSSAVVDRGFVTYSNAAKMDMLGVRSATLAAHGAVSEQVALEMAEGAIANSCADIAISITGIAGPGGSEHKPEGRVCFGIARKGMKTNTETIEFGSVGRDQVRLLSRNQALEMLARELG
jgi:nicotinamide-nucleotide amidase